MKDFRLRLTRLAAAGCLLVTASVGTAAYAADCADLAAYCSAFARIWSAYTGGYQPTFSDVASLADAGYQSEGAKALKHFHAAAKGIWACRVGDPDTASTLCQKYCDENPSGEAIRDSMTKDCLKARGPQLQ
jgi:hypothetical protein